MPGGVKEFLENAENAQGNEGGHRNGGKRNIQLKKIFQC